MLADNRLSLAAAILRQSLSETIVKWVKPEQINADILTKVLSGRYARDAPEGGTWTLGPDERAPNSRGRRLAHPDRVTRPICGGPQQANAAVRLQEQAR